MNYHQGEDDGNPHMSFSPTGRTEDLARHAFLGMSPKENRLYATRWLLDLWERDPNGKVWLDGKLFEPTDEDIAEVEERREAIRAKLTAKPVHITSSTDITDDLVSAKNEIEEVLHEEAAPMRARMAETMQRVLARKRKVVKCAPGGAWLRQQAKL